jgi:hypothetical protein
LTTLLTVAFFAFHAPYRPASLEDLDSINFALGVRHFDVAEHQPHPPGYPVYIAAAKTVRWVGQVGRVGTASASVAAGAPAVPAEERLPSELVAMWAVSIVSATAGVLAIAIVFRRIDPALPVEWSFASTALAVTAPLYWFTAARPLSDAMGLAASLAVQALALAASSAGGLAAASFAAGIAGGIRSQVLWLTVPLLALRGIELTRRDGDRQRSGPAIATSTVAAYIAGVLVWALPLVALTGGPAGYLRALSRQGSEDFSGVRMLLTSPTPRALAGALYYTFVAPWASEWVAVAVLVLAAVGYGALARRGQRTAMLLACAFGPYLVFHIVFQETVTGRYALPLVIPLAFCAVAGARTMLGRAGLVAVAAVAMFCAHIGGTSVAAYSREKAPAFRLLDDMHAASATTNVAVVLAPDRREEFDLRRPIRWLGDAMPPIDRKLAAPPQHEWRRPRAGLAHRRSNAERRGSGGAGEWRHRGEAVSLARAVPGPAERRAAERDGLVSSGAARLVRRRRVGADA